MRHHCCADGFWSEGWFGHIVASWPPLSKHTTNPTNPLSYLLSNDLKPANIAAKSDEPNKYYPGCKKIITFCNCVCQTNAMFQGRFKKTVQNFEQADNIRGGGASAYRKAVHFLLALFVSICFLLPSAVIEFFLEQKL